MKKKRTNALTEREQKLIEKNAKKIHKMVWSIADDAGLDLKNNIDLYEELISVANDVMIECVGHYNHEHEKKARFTTFCYPYLCGAMSHYIDRESRKMSVVNGEWTKIEVVSLDKRISDDDDSYTLKDVIAMPTDDENERQEEMERVVGLILAELSADEVEMVKQVFWSKNATETMRQIAKQKGTKFEKIKEQMRGLILKMGEIAISKGITYKF